MKGDEPPKNIKMKWGGSDYGDYKPATVTAVDPSDRRAGQSQERQDEKSPERCYHACLPPLNGLDRVRSHERLVNDSTLTASNCHGLTVKITSTK